MKKNFSILLIIILSISLVFTACENKEDFNDETIDNSISEENQFAIKLTDAHGREFVLEKEAKRIVSVSPDLTEIIFALGEEERLVGRSDFCNYPEDTKEIPSVGAIDDPNIEKIAELQPDLVIGSRIFPRDSDAKLQELNIPVLILDSQQSFEGIYDMIESMGQVLSVPDKAEALVMEIENKVQNVSEKVKDVSRPRVYYVVGFGEAGDFTAGGDTFIGTIIEMAGGDNVAKDLQGWQYSLEKLIEQDPDIIICSKYYDAKAGIEQAQGYKDLRAVKEGRLLEIDNNLLDRQGPRLADGLEELAKLIHPELFAN